MSQLQVQRYKGYVRKNGHGLKGQWGSGVPRGNQVLLEHVREGNFQGRRQDMGIFADNQP